MNAKQNKWAEFTQEIQESLEIQETRDTLETQDTTAIGEKKLRDLERRARENQDSFKVDSPTDLPTDKMNAESCLRVIQQTYSTFQCSEEDAIAGLVKLIQDGGTNTSKRSLTVTINGTPFDIETVRKIISTIEKKGTVRKFAKGIRSMVATVAKINQWPGPLFKDIRRNNPNLEFQEDWPIWCNEIHSDNYQDECPAQIREALQRREQSLRETMLANSKKSPKQNKSNKSRKRGKNRKIKP